MSSARNLTLTEELEKLEQSITLTLQEIDHNFSKAHRIVTSGIIPAVQQYERHSGQVWEGTKFWKEFFEASANVSLTSEEEVAAAADQDQTQDAIEHSVEHVEQESGVTTPSRQDDETIVDEHTSTSQFEDLDTSAFDSPFAAPGRVQSTPQISSVQGKGRTKLSASSPAPRRLSGPKAGALSLASRGRSAAEEEEPSTPRAQPQARNDLDSSPFEPLPSRGTAQRRTANEPLLHRILDRNYRVQATPLTRNPWDPVSAMKKTSTLPGRDESKTPLGPGSANVSKARLGGKAFEDDSMLDSSPLNSPEMPTLSIRPEQLARSRTPAGRRALMAMTPAGERAPRTPGVSVQRPLYGIAKAPNSMFESTIRAGPSASTHASQGFTGSVLHHPTGTGASAARPGAETATGGVLGDTAWQQRGQKTPALWDSDSDEEEPSLTMPKTLTFDLKHGARTRSGPEAAGRSGPAAGPGAGAGPAPGLRPPPTRPILQTPAREASRRIVEDILSTARKQHPSQSQLKGSTGGGGGGGGGGGIENHSITGTSGTSGTYKAGGLDFDDDTFFDDTDDDIVDFRGRAGPLRSPGLSAKRGGGGGGGGVAAEGVGLETDEEPSEVEYSPSIVRKAMLDDDDAF